jgi:hypothetical protein
MEPALVKTGTVMIVLVAGVLAACTKNSDGDMVVKTPVIETRTDTVKMPSVKVTRDTIQTVTPKIEVKKETSTVTVPHVTVTRKP